MTKDEALKMALEALCVAVEPKKGKVYAREFEPIDCFAMHEQAITAIKEALAQPEQEPVAWVCMKGEEHDIDFDQSEIDAISVGTFLYTTPPQRPWVGLTDEEKQAAYIIVDGWSNCVNFIEKTLREKNT